MVDPKGQDVALATIHSAPGIIASLYTMNGLVTLLTGVFVILQIAYLAWKWRRDVRRIAQDKAAMDYMMGGRVAKPGERAPR